MEQLIFSFVSLFEYNADKLEMNILFILSLLFFTFNHKVYAESFVNESKKKVETYFKNNPKAKEALDTVVKAMNAYDFKKIHLESEQVVDISPCPHCPGYQRLTGHVSGILKELAKDQSPYEEHDLNSRLNRLDFMYYELRSNNSNGRSDCNREFNINSDRVLFSDRPGKYQLLLENMIVFSDITDARFSDLTTSEVAYYYRGTGNQSDVIIEVIHNVQSKAAVIRYYKYIKGENVVPFIEDKKIPIPAKENISKTKEVSDENNGKLSVQFNPKIVNGVSDIHILDVGLKKSALSENVKMGVDGKISTKEASLYAILTGVKDEKLVSVSIKANIDEQKYETVVVVPASLTFNVDQSSNIVIKGEYKADIKTSVAKKTSSSAANLSLAKTYDDYDKYKLDFLLVENPEDQTYRSEVGASYSQDKHGSYKISYQRDGMGNEKYGLAYTKKAKDYSLILGVSTDPLNDSKVYMQYEHKIW